MTFSRVRDHFPKHPERLVLYLLLPVTMVTVWFILDIGNDTGALREAQAQADRNLAVQACTSRYAATATAWEDEADRIEAIIVKRAVDDDPIDPGLTDDVVEATEAAKEMTGRRIGLADLAAEQLALPHSEENMFDCPPIPERLMVEPLDPSDPDPP